MASSLTLDEILAQKNAGIEELQSRRQRKGKQLAEWVERTPDAIEQGIDLVRRRLARRYCHGRELYLEWEGLLNSSPKEEIVQLLRDDSEHSEQLRACAPFFLQDDKR